MSRMKQRFKELVSSEALMAYDDYIKMNQIVPRTGNFRATVIQMAGFEVVHLCVIVTGYGLLPELLEKNKSHLNGPALFWLPFAYMATHSVMIFVFHIWLSYNVEHSDLRRGDTAKIVTCFYAVLALILLCLDVSPDIQKFGLFLTAVLVSLGQKATMYRSYLVLGLSPDHQFDLQMILLRFIFSTVSIVWALLFGVTRVWLFASLIVFAYLFVALLYYFGLSRMEVSGPTLQLLHAAMPYDNGDLPNQQKFEHESFEAQRQINIMLERFIAGEVRAINHRSELPQDDPAQLSRVDVRKRVELLRWWTFT